MVTVRLCQPLTAIDLTTVGDTYAKSQELANHCQPLRCCPQTVCYKVSVGHTHGHLFIQSLLQDNDSHSLQQGLGTHKALISYLLSEDIAGPSCKALSGHPLWTLRPLGTQHSCLLFCARGRPTGPTSTGHWLLFTGTICLAPLLFPSCTVKEAHGRFAKAF